MLPRLKSSILTGKLQWDTHICGNPTPLCLPLSLHLAIHLCHRGLLCAADYFPSACLPTTFPKQFALTTATAFAVLNHSVIDFYTAYLKSCNSLLMSISFNFQSIRNIRNFSFKYQGKRICPSLRSMLFTKTCFWNTWCTDTNFPCDKIYQSTSLLIWREWIFSFHFRNYPKYTTHFFHSTDSLPITKKRRRGEKGS